MTNEIIKSEAEAVKLLTRLRERLAGHKTALSKRHMRPSERAMAMAAYQQEMEALSLAILALTKEPSNGPPGTA